MSRIVWTGKLRDQAVRVVEDNDDHSIAERLTGHDAMDNERWEPILTKQALDELRPALPVGVVIGDKPKPAKKLPYGLVTIPKGLTFRDLTRVNEAGERALLLMFPTGFEDEDNLTAIELALTGERGKMVLDGRYERGSFYVQGVNYYPKGEDPIVEESPCPMIVDALRRHLKRGDPEERFALAGTTSVTAARMLDLLAEGDARVLRYVQDVHDAALRTVRRRQRKPSRRPSW